MLAYFVTGEAIALSLLANCRPRLPWFCTRQFGCTAPKACLHIPNAEDRNFLCLLKFLCITSSAVVDPPVSSLHLYFCYGLVKCAANNMLSVPKLQVHGLVSCDPFCPWLTNLPNNCNRIEIKVMTKTKYLPQLVVQDISGQHLL